MNYAFYDLETSGKSPEFDQPLQFAAILTDENFNEIEHVNIRCRLVPHIIPSPIALAITGVDPTDLRDPAKATLFDFSKELSSLIKRWSPAIWTGFNNIRFDEEFLRQAFYQNLQPDKYATQSNGNLRFDILPAMHAAWIKNPNLIDWPVNESGNLVFRLEMLAPRAGFIEHNAHDALGDVKATIHLARLLAKREPSMWAELLANCEKQSVKTRLESFEPYLLVSRVGGNAPRGLVGCFCGYAADNGNRAGFFDLDVDPSEWLEADHELILEKGLKIVRTLSINKTPTLLSVSSASELHLVRAKMIANSSVFHERVSKALAGRYSTAEDGNRPVEKTIYDGFLSSYDKRIMQKFQEVDWPSRASIISAFEDQRLRQLGRRLIGNYAAEYLSENERSKYVTWVHQRWNSETDDQWTTLGLAKKELEKLENEEKWDREHLGKIRGFLKQYENEL